MQSFCFKFLLPKSFSESKQSEVKLDEIDPNDFRVLLELLHGKSSIDDTNIVKILEVARMFSSPTALRRCEQFLKDESKLSVGKKLELASRYKLKDLKIKCLSEVTTLNDLYLIDNFNANELDDKILRVLLRKCVELS